MPLDHSNFRQLQPTVAIVGRPNVGKSTLFNRLIGRRRAIVGNEPGITRDRIYGEADWRTHRFAIVDTGGIVPNDDAAIPSNIFKQAGVAIEEAQALVWVVDARKGITPLDEELARLLRATGKPVFIAANKTDTAGLETEAVDFHRFGFHEVFPISAEQGNGIGELLDALITQWPGDSPTVREGSERSSRKGAKPQREVERLEAALVPPGADK